MGGSSLGTAYTCLRMRRYCATNAGTPEPSREPPPSLPFSLPPLPRGQAILIPGRYWDEVHDAGHFSASDVFSPRDGFGGDGAGPDDCIQDGPFAEYILHMGPGYSNTEHCITRSINDNVSNAASLHRIQECLQQPDFANAWPCIEAAPHIAGHRGVGAGMVRPPPRALC